MADTVIVMYDAFAETLAYGSKSIRYQLNIPDKRDPADHYATIPHGDAGRTLDGALRKARKRATRKNPVILVTAHKLVPYDSDEESIAFGIICEVIRKTRD
jgi:hypothetical protein